MVLLQIALAVVGFILYKFVASARENRRIKAFADKNGCEEPVDMTGGAYLGGFKRLRRMLYIPQIISSLIWTQLIVA